MHPTALTEAELDELEVCLFTMSDKAMNLSMLDGYLTAIAVGPNTLVPSQWLAYIWGKGDTVPEFQSPAEAEKIMSVIFRQLNEISTIANTYDGLVSPIFNWDDSHTYDDGRDWAEGFRYGMGLDIAGWAPLFTDDELMMSIGPLILLSSLPSDLEPIDAGQIATAEQRHEVANALPSAIYHIYQFWLPHRQTNAAQQHGHTIVRDSAKIGRNDPCPCGSGKKFKKCCGAAGNLH